MRLIKDKQLYQSPELFHSLTHSDNSIKFNPLKEDAFSLGLTILEAGIQNNFQEIYDEKNQSFDWKIFNLLIEEFEGNYPHNKLLKNAVKMLLSTHNKRIDILSMQNKLIPYVKFKEAIRLGREQEFMKYNDLDKFKAFMNY